MPISFPTTGLTPGVTTYTYSGLTWLWTGDVWQSVGTVQGVNGAQGTDGIQGLQGTQGIQGSTPLLSGVTPAAVGTASPGISTSASRDDHVHSIANVAYTNTSNTFTTGQYVFNSTASVVPFAIRGAGSQSADLLTLQNSVGQAAINVDSAGVLRTRSSFAGSITMAAGATGEQSSVSIYSYNSARKCLVLKGTTSQTANLQEWWDVNNTSLSAVDAAGNFNKGDGDQLVLANQIF